MAKAKARNSKKYIPIRVIERKLGREKADGQCFKGQHLIEIDPRQDAYEYLDTFCHEILHELLPCRTEDFIAKAGTTLAKAMWKHGFRRVSLK